MNGSAPRISVIIPAYNEATGLGGALHGIRGALHALAESAGQHGELIVVDNASTDGTAAVAKQSGATVIREPVRNIACARNAGAKASSGEILIFLDADTHIPASLFRRIVEILADPRCAGGAVDLEHPAARWPVRAYLQLWRALGTLAGMAQGAAQFCRRPVFEELGGYDETLFMGEDVDFYWRLQNHARRRGLRVQFLREVRVAPAPRRFDQWPLWRILVWTIPLVILLFRRRKSFWPGWYRSPPR
jgi:glycosyltransferase involved in cell wall biosynthesis